jgi:hypothetical protein
MSQRAILLTTLNALKMTRGRLQESICGCKLTHSVPALAGGEEAMSPKVPSDWRLTWLLLGVIIGLLGLIVIEVVAKRYL